MRRGSILQMLVISLVVAAISVATAVLVPWLPIAASREAGRIDFTFWFANVIGLVVFAFVIAVLIYAWLNFRVADDDFSEDGPPIHGNTRLEVIWTIIPFILVLAITIVSAIVLSDNGKAGNNPLKITVIGQQFAWTFQYPNGQIYTTMHLPVNRPVVLDITSKDVIHSFWVPQFAQKQDAVPGIDTRLVITPDRLGNYPVICVELCGLGHSLMRSEAIVMTTADYTRWYAGTAAPAGGGAGAAVQTFKSNGCAACHTLSAIPGAVGKVGPSLDNLKAQAAASHLSLVAYITRAIVTPYAHIPKGYAAGVMPATFATTIPKTQLAGLVQYLAAHTH